MEIKNHQDIEQQTLLSNSQVEEKIAHAVFQNSLEAIMITDPCGKILNVNPAFTHITGYCAKEVTGRTPRILKSYYHDHQFYETMRKKVSEDGYWQGEVWNRKKNGEIYPEWKTIFSIKNEKEEVTHLVSVGNDLSALKDKEALINRLAYFDAVTGLPNRSLFRDLGSLALRQAQHLQEQVAMMTLDISRFKKVNETLGHSAGDIILNQVSSRIQEKMREGDALSRLGGDEFKLLLPKMRDEEDALKWAKNILNIFQEPFQLESHEIYLSGRMGISLYPRDGKDVETLLKHADTALYRAKRNGHRYQFYSPSMNQQSIVLLELETRLRKAIEREEFEVFYQPQYEIKTNAFIGVEALIRWNHPELGMVSPARFIPLAEETGLIIPIGEWTIRKACQQIKAWQKDLQHPIRLAVNLSVLQFKTRKITSTIAGILKETDFPAEQLELEITESMAMDAEYTVSILHEFKKLGVKVAIDDFGTGYSSLSYLRRFPIDTLKIDQSFIQDMVSDANDRSIVSTIISMAHHLKLRVIAEGVEDREQFDLLKSFQCDETQGYYFHPPLPIADLKQAIKP